MKPAIQEMDISEQKDTKEIVYFKDLWKAGRFEEQAELGSGASCRVCKVRVKKTGNCAAMKEMKRDDEFNPSSFVKEIAILHKLKGHSNVLQFEAGYLDDINYFIQTGLLEGGELFDRIHTLRRFSEPLASKHVLYILDAIQHSHNFQIVHRDLKPENMVYKASKGGPETLTIIDFGDAKLVQDHSHIRGICWNCILPSSRNRSKKKGARNEKIRCLVDRGNYIRPANRPTTILGKF
eukprot:UN02082